MAERKPVGNMGLTGDELFEAIREGMARRGVSDRRPAVTPFEVGGWHIHLRTLTAEWHAALNKRAEDHPGDEAGFAALLLSASVCDAESNTMLTCEQAAQ
jgi:hypothetical protein